MTSGSLHLLVIIAAVSGAFAPMPSGPNASDTAASTTGRPSISSAVSSQAPATSTAPDGVAEYVGGIAARLHTSDDERIPGNLFMLMATAGSGEHARLYDQTRYTHDNGIASDTFESNVTAIEVVETITGADLQLLDFTSAPGGGSSGGLIYAISYLNIVSDGAFTGDVRVAATGQLGAHGYVHAIDAIDEKTGAAHLAEADVLFTPTTPSTDNIDAYGTRHIGELFRARNTGAPLAEERHLDHYRNWGSDRPVGMDIVGTRHIADVAAYLCGTGSEYACDMLVVLADDIIGAPAHTEESEPPNTAMPADLR